MQHVVYYWDVRKGNLTAQNTRKPYGGRGSAPTPLGSLQRSQTPIADGHGAGSHPKNPTPRCPSLKPHPTPAIGPSGLAPTPVQN